MSLQNGFNPLSAAGFDGLPLIKVKHKTSKVRISFFAPLLAANWVKSDGQSDNVYGRHPCVGVNLHGVYRRHPRSTG